MLTCISILYITGIFYWIQEFILQWNTSHSIAHIGFGDDYPGLVNPLDSTEQIAKSGTSTQL